MPDLEDITRDRIGAFEPAGDGLEKTLRLVRRRQRKRRFVAGSAALAVAASGLAFAAWAFSHDRVSRPGHPSPRPTAPMIRNGAIAFEKVTSTTLITRTPDTITIETREIFSVNPDGSDLRQLTFPPELERIAGLVAEGRRPPPSPDSTHPSGPQGRLEPICS